MESAITLSKRKGKGGRGRVLSAITLSKRKGKGEGGRGKSAIALSTNETAELAFFLPP